MLLYMKSQSQNKKNKAHVQSWIWNKIIESKILLFYSCLYIYVMKPHTSNELLIFQKNT